MTSAIEAENEYQIRAGILDGLDDDQRYNDLFIQHGLMKIKYDGEIDRLTDRHNTSSWINIVQGVIIILYVAFSIIF